MSETWGTITMIPVEKLRHHPENPRLDLGDLTELAASIKENGIMQNLTVVRPTFYAEGDDDIWWVVIGNRRMEASKLAGLEEVPCAIADMDQRTQIATMIQENMQRADLTVYEQAQGFQMMLDLGFKPERIAERTGISETTVRRRLKMAELDRDVLRKACAEPGKDRQITLADFDRLARVEDVQKRNQILQQIGSRDFDWALTRALREQKAAENMPKVKQILKDAKIPKLDRSEKWSDKYERVKDLQIYDWDPSKPLIPESDEPLWYYLEDYSLEFKKKRKRVINPANVKSEAEKEEERRIAEAWQKIREDSDTARQLRRAFADTLVAGQKNLLGMFRALMTAAIQAQICFCSYSEQLRDYFGFDSSVGLPQRQKMVADVFRAEDIGNWPKIIRLLFDPDNNCSYVGGYQREMPVWKENPMLDAYYLWLTQFGYQMSRTEMQLMNGTHPCFKTSSTAAEG